MPYNSTCKSNIVKIKTVAYFVRIFIDEVSKLISNINFRTNLTPRNITPSVPYISFNRIQLRSHYVILALLYDITRGENHLSFIL